MNLNKAELIGNLAVTPEVKTLPSGQSVASFRMATNHIWKDPKTKKKHENTEFHSVIAWGRLGEIVGQYLKKGDKVYIDGRLQTRNWEDDKKIKHFKTEIIANNLIMLGGAKKQEEDDVEKVNNEVVVEEIDVSKATA